jgi:hypothetical protein
MKLRALLNGTPAMPKPAPDPQCTAITKAGTRCRLPHLPGSDKCVLHQP